MPKNLQLVYIDKIYVGHEQASPESLRIPSLERIYQGHFISNQQNVPSNPQYFQYISEVLPHPWHTLGTDLFYHRKQDYLVLVDYFSKFLIVKKLPNSTSGAVVKELSITFSEYGISFIIWSDNGPCYSSQEFKTLVQDLQVTHCTSSPHYPQFNGMVESMAKISKNLIEKAIQSDKPWHSFIQEYRITLLSSTISSPAEILFGRQILYQDNLYDIRIHSPRNDYQVQSKKIFRSHIPTPLYHKIIWPSTGGKIHMKP